MKHRPLHRTLAGLAAAAAAILGAPGARAADITEQHLEVDVGGDVLHEVIDAHIAGFDARFPIYTLATDATVVEVNGAAATLEVDPDPQYMGLVSWVTPADKHQSGDVDVHIVLDGAPHCASQLQPGTDACTFSDDERVLLPAEPGAAFYLVNLFAADPFVGTVSVRAASDMFIAAGQGAATATDDNGDGTVTAHFDLVVPSDTLGVFARRFDDVVSATTSDGKRVTAGVPPDQQGGDAHQAMQRVVDTGAKILPRYEDMFGALPLDEVHYLPVSGRFPFGGEGLLGDIMLGDFITWPDFDYLIEQGAAHELGHSWWAGLASASDPDEGGFLQEAFAEYSAWRALGVDDDAIRTSGARMNAVWYLTQIGDADVPILGAGQDESYVLVTYHKGSVFLRTLEERVGTAAFTDALAALIERGPGGLSVDALEEDVANASGERKDDIAAFCDQWLARPGFPTLSVGFDGRSLAVDLDADDNTATDWRFDLPVRATSADGTVKEIELHVGDDASVALDTHTVLVEIDPRWTSVRAVKPKLAGDVSLDGRVDAVDLMEVALHAGGAIPAARRVDGRYDPLYDLDKSGAVDDKDADAVVAALP